MYTIKRPAVFEDGSDVDGGNPEGWTYVDGEYLGVNFTHDRLWDGKTWEEAGYTEKPQTNALWFDVQMGDYAKWIFISPAAYATYLQKFALKNTLEEAEKQGVTDLSAEEAVLNNPNATLEEVDAAIMSLNEKIGSLINPENPVDMTSSIVNPDIENGINGWSSTTKARNNATATNITNDKNRNPEGAFTDHFYENWNPQPFTGKMYQTVKNLPNGVYKCSLAAFINVFDEKNAETINQYVFFNDTKLPLTTGNAKMYSRFIDVTNNTIELGLAQETAVSEWMGLDNASIIYYGQGLEAYKYTTKSLLSILDELDAEGATYGTAYADALKAIVAQAENATTKEQALAIYAQTQPVVDALYANVAAYKALARLYDKFEDWIYTEGLSSAEEYEPQVEEMLGNVNVTTEEILAFIAEVEAAVEQERKNQAQPGDDVTDRLIKNPAFTTATDPDAEEGANQDFTGWTREGSKPGAGGATDLRLCEVYEGDFEIYQDLTGIQKGAYQLEIQAFMRPGSAETAYSNWEAGNKETPAYVYAGDNKVTVKSICDFMIEGSSAPTETKDWSNVGGTYWIPNSMKTAYEAMAMNRANYNNVITALCIDGNMRIGLGANDPNATGSRWMIFRDFKLTYLGNDATVIAPVLNDLIDAAVKGKMANTEATALQNAIATAQNAIAAKDGDAMMTAYRELAKANEDAKISVAAYEELYAAIENLMNAIADYADKASADAFSAAENLLEEVSTAYEDGTIETADCAAKITEINITIIKLKSQEGSDAEPADYTWAIKNPDMADGTANWTCVNNGANPGVAYQVMEGYNGNFDVYQDIENLPEGTYLVKCQGFYRYGWNEGAFKAWEEGSIQYNGRLYANRDTVGLKSVTVIDESAQSASGDAGNWFAYEHEGQTYYCPNQRVAAQERFAQELYPNEVYTYVDESGKLRIGFCNNNHVDGDWTTASFFQLFYLGTESEHEGATGITDINSNEVVGSQFYTIDGRRTNGLSKGLNIIKTVDANGKTSVRKVIVK